MSNNNDNVLAIIVFSIMFISLALMWLYPSFFYIGLLLLVLTIIAIFYFVLFHGKVKPIWGIFLTCLIWVLVYFGLYIEKIPFIKRHFESTTWFTSNRFGNIIITIVIALVLFVFRIPKD